MIYIVINHDDKANDLDEDKVSKKLSGDLMAVDHHHHHHHQCDSQTQEFKKTFRRSDGRGGVDGGRQR